MKTYLLFCVTLSQAASAWLSGRSVPSLTTSLFQKAPDSSSPSVHSDGPRLRLSFPVWEVTLHAGQIPITAQISWLLPHSHSVSPAWSECGEGSSLFLFSYSLLFNKLYLDTDYTHMDIKGEIHPFSTFYYVVSIP